MMTFRPILLAFAALTAACSSGSGGSSGSCPDIAACYGVSFHLTSGTVADCGPADQMVLIDLTGAAQGTIMTTAGCSGSVNGCGMSLTCPGNEAYAVTFSDGTVSVTATAPTDGGASCTFEGTGGKVACR